MGLAVTRHEQFWEACGFGHVDKVKNFLAEGVNVNWISPIHNSCPIHVAAQAHIEVVKLLIQANCDVNIRDDRGHAALHHAAIRGLTEIMKALIGAGADCNAVANNGWTVLHSAAYFGYPDAVQLLLENGAKVGIVNNDNRTALHELARSPVGLEDELERVGDHLIEAGDDVNVQAAGNGDANFTPLMFAAYHDHLGVARAILKSKNCDKNKQSANGFTALHWAADRQNVELVTLLLESGADATLPGLRGELPIMRVRSEECRQLLRERMEVQSALKKRQSDLARQAACAERQAKVAQENASRQEAVKRRASTPLAKTPSAASEATVAAFVDSFFAATTTVTNYKNGSANGNSCHIEYKAESYRNSVPTVVVPPPSSLITAMSSLTTTSGNGHA